MKAKFSKHEPQLEVLVTRENSEIAKVWLLEPRLIGTVKQVGTRTNPLWRTHDQFDFRKAVDAAVHMVESLFRGLR